MGDNNEPIKLNLYVPFCKCWFVLIEGFYSFGIISAKAKNSVDYGKYILKAITWMQIVDLSCDESKW